MDALRNFRATFFRRPSWRAVALVACVLAFLSTAVYLVGSLPVRGVVMVDSDQSDRLSDILHENRMFLWSGVTQIRYMAVEFKNPIALCKIDDQVLDDARQHGYQCRITYECVIPYFNYERSVNRSRRPL